MKELICNFKINDKTYSIYNVDFIEGKTTYIGVTDYGTREILIENGNYSDMIETLIHELMHVWLYENGYKNQDDGCLTFEQICEYVAKSFDFIEKNVKRYDNYITMLHFRDLYLED